MEVELGRLCACIAGDGCAEAGFGGGPIMASDSGSGEIELVPELVWLYGACGAVGDVGEVAGFCAWSIGCCIDLDELTEESVPFRPDWTGLAIGDFPTRVFVDADRAALGRFCLWRPFC